MLYEVITSYSTGNNVAALNHNLLTITYPVEAELSGPPAVTCDYGVDRVAVAQARAFDRHKCVDRNRLWLGIEVAQLGQQADPVLAPLAHADDAAATNLQAGLADPCNRLQAVAIGMRRDDAGSYNFV